MVISEKQKAFLNLHESILKSVILILPSSSDKEIITITNNIFTAYVDVIMTPEEKRDDIINYYMHSNL